MSAPGPESPPRSEELRCELQALRDWRVMLAKEIGRFLKPCADSGYFALVKNLLPGSYMLKFSAILRQLPRAVNYHGNVQPHH